MTARCMAKRGFFSLRDCGEPSTAQCRDCMRAMCSVHLSPGSGYKRCLDCEARKPVADTHDNYNYTDPVWPYRYRRGYYSSRHYGPMYSGRYYDNYYNDYDYRTFDRDMRRDNAVSATDRDSTGFGDS